MKVFLLTAAFIAPFAPVRGQTPVQMDQAVEATPPRGLARGALGSVRVLLKIAYPMAREWSPGAKLYAAYGRAPRNQERWESARWGLIFGDPEVKDGSFHVIFEDGAIKVRQGTKGHVLMADYFKEGKFQNRETEITADYSNGDYSSCRPVDPQFVDVDALERLIRKHALAPGALDQYGFSLFSPMNEQCDGLGRKSLFLDDKPIPRKLLKRTLWIIHASSEVVYVDAHRGEVLSRRPL